MTTLAEQHLVALAERAGATAATSDLVAALAMQSVKVGADGAVQIVDAAGNTRIGAGPHYGPMTLRELVDEIAHAKPVLFRHHPASEPVRVKPQTLAAPQAETSGNMTVDFLRRHHGPEAATRAEAAAAAQATPDGRAEIAANLARGAQNIRDSHDMVKVTERRTTEAIERHRAGPEAKSDAGNPFTRATWNVTQQILMLTRDPERAAKLKTEAAAIPAHLDRVF